MTTPAHKQTDPSKLPGQVLGDYIDRVNRAEKLIDFDSDAPLACPLDKEDGETCESCQ